MNMFIIDNELFIRLGCFMGIFIAMSAWESIAPRRALTSSKSLRWINNLSLTFLNSLVVRIFFPAAAVGMAIAGT